jgi:prevent-host-death family protein
MNKYMEVNIHEAKTNFSKLLQRVILGDEIIIAKAGVPVAKLVRYTTEKGQEASRILPGPNLDGG